MTIQNRIYQSNVRGLQENTAGMGSGAMGANQRRPKAPMGPNQPSIANTISGLMRSGGGDGGWTTLGAFETTEQWQAQWDAWVEGGGVGEMPWPPQFQGLFTSNDVFDIGIDLNHTNPHSGWFYYNSIFNWLFGSDPRYWGDGALRQMGDAGLIDLPNWSSMPWNFFYEYLAGVGGYGGGPYAPLRNVLLIQAMFGDPQSEAYQNADWSFLGGFLNSPYASLVGHVWLRLAEWFPGIVNKPPQGLID